MKPSPSTHTLTARTWTARLADGRAIQFSAPTEQLAERLIAETRVERTRIVGVASQFPPVGWPKTYKDLIATLVAAKTMDPSRAKPLLPRAA